MTRGLQSCAFPSLKFLSLEHIFLRADLVRNRDPGMIHHGSFPSLLEALAQENFLPVFTVRTLVDHLEVKLIEVGATV